MPIMKELYYQPLALRLALYTILLGIVIGMFFAVFEIRSDYVRTTDGVVESAEQMVELTLDAATAAVFELNPTLADNLLSGLMRNEFFLSAAISDELQQPLASQSRERRDFTGLTSLISVDPVELDYDLKFAEADNSSGSLRVVLDVQAGLASFYSQTLLTVLGELVEVMGLSVLIFLLVAVMITTPVSKLAEQISRIEPGSNERLASGRKRKIHDEISKLITSANKYLDATSKVQKDLAENRKQLQVILNNLTEGILLLDEDGFVIESNPSAAALFKNHDLTLNNTNFLDVLDSKQFASYKTLIQHFDGHTINEIQIPGEDKEPISIEFSVTAIEFDGRPHTLWTLKDISERKKAENEREKLEAQLNHSQKMEAIGTLAGGVAHDFNNILGGISGFTEMTLQELKGDKKARQYLENILKSTDKATQLINRILAFSYKQGESREPIDLACVLEDCIALMKHTIPTTIDLKVIPKGETPFVMADETMMHQVMMNLIANAANAIGNTAGKICCSLNKESVNKEELQQELSVSKDELFEVTEFVRLSIDDTGGGIPDQIINRIFEPYFTTKDLGTGTGLGLAITHTLVKKHGGFIRVDSSPDGTRFDVFLPALAGHHTYNNSDKLPEEEQIVEGAERILIVEDNEMLADMLTQYLEDLGYATTSKPNGIEAYDEYTSTKDGYDLVITDQTMPGMNGDLLIKKILDINREQAVILCTGYSESIDAQQARAMGIKHFLIKPVSVIELGKLVRSILDDAQNPSS